MHNLCVFYIFIVQKSFLIQNCLLIAVINLNTWGPLYTCLGLSVISCVIKGAYRISYLRAEQGNPEEGHYRSLWGIFGKWPVLNHFSCWEQEIYTLFPIDVRLVIHFMVRFKSSRSISLNIQVLLIFPALFE